ncbi:MAG: RDD family protein [Bacteroidetes bacterium]|nr:RDD family protein [Bacteroidota bacterium]
MEIGSGTPAGPRRRLLAFCWDYLVILTYLVPLVGLGVLINRFAPEVAAALFESPLKAQAMGFMLITLPVALYFVLSEASTRQATYGKRRLSLVVQDVNGSRIGISRSIVRTAAKFTPWELAHYFIWQSSFSDSPESPVFAAGFVTVWVLVGGDLAAMFFGRKYRTLHDRISGTSVVRM